jgi:hypothetical protein
MRYKIPFLILFSFFFVSSFAQQQPDKNKLRIVDTLSAKERSSRNPVILRAELDSLIQLYTVNVPEVKPQPPVEKIIAKTPNWVVITGIIALLIITFLLFKLFRYHKRLGRAVSDLKRLIQNFDFYTSVGSNGNTDKTAKGKSAVEKKIAILTAELDKVKKENQMLLREYDAIKQGITESYKVKNYPSYNKEKSEGQIITDLLLTERAVAAHAFEKFLKPVISIADANKNNPAKISSDDSEKMLELLISLSLYYIEYLYLRVNDLSVGGNIVQRIGSNGKGIDPGLLKKLNTEHGSRALALRMALNKSGIARLSYPVFDETDLNNF